MVIIMKTKKLFISLFTALLVLLSSSIGLAATAQVSSMSGMVDASLVESSETSGTGDVTFVAPEQWRVAFFGNNVPQADLADSGEQVELRYIADGLTLGVNTPTHAAFVTPNAPDGYFYRFAGWNTQRNGNGESFTHNQISTLAITRHMRLYAQWSL